jgi:DNA-binding MarR family transcriptional regulator
MFERCLYFNINALARKVNRIWDKAFDELGLSPAHAYLLRLVLAEPGLSQLEITKELRLEKSTVTRFIDALEERGYLRRERIGRETVIHPATAARKLEDDLNRKGDDLYKRMTKSVGKQNLKDLVRELREVGESLD